MKKQLLNIPHILHGFALFAVILTFISCSENQSSVTIYKEQLTELDSLIQLRPQFQQEKEQKIEDAKKRLARLTSGNEQRYTVNQEIQYLYKGYICDSLIYYIYENIRLAQQIKDPYRETESQLTLAINLAKSGMYLEAVLLMDNIDRNKVAPDLLDLYYHVYHVVYKQKAYITRDRNFSETTLAPLARLYQDSLIAAMDSTSDIFYEVMFQKYMDDRRYEEAFSLSEKQMASPLTDERDYAHIWYNIGEIRNIQGDVHGFFEAMINSAKVDMAQSIKDHASLHRIARTLYEWDDVSRAAGYIQICMEDAYFYNANLRSLQIAKTLPVVTNAYEIKNQKHISTLRIRSTVIFILLFLCIGILFVVVKQKNKLSRMHRILKESNDNLNIMSRKLSDTNIHLNEVNNELLQNNYIKENYVAHFIQLSSDYINKNDLFKLEINKLLRKGKVEEALRMTLYTGANETELEEFYANFDNAFLSIFPNFISEYNKLMTEENQVLIPERKRDGMTLPTELRVFALIRLGFSDSATIARMLRYSINTIYNIRSKAKTKARVSKDEFEPLIMKTGVIIQDKTE